MNGSTLQDQVTLITGAGRPPAPGLALALADQGAIIAANDLTPTLLDPLDNAVRARRGRIRTYIADATRGMPLRAMLDEILDDFGRIDILINNPRIQPEAPILAMDEWDWQRAIEMNLNGPFLVTQLVARLMKEQGRGVILNLVDANPHTLVAPGHAAYAASQQGLLTLSQAAARELIAYNIRVHTLCPDETLLNQETLLVEAQATPASLEKERALAGLAVYLCGPQGAHLAGQVYRVDDATRAGQQE